MSIMKRFVILLAGLVVAAQLWAGDQSLPQDEVFIGNGASDWKGHKLSGWDGILFYCWTSEKSADPLKEICKRTTINAEFLAAAGKVELIKGRNLIQVTERALVEDHLVLTVELVATKNGKPYGVHADIRAYAGYLKAIDKSTFTAKSRGPKSVPRTGELLLWEDCVIGSTSGTLEEIVGPMSDAIEQQLKKFFADYMKAQN